MAITDLSSFISKNGVATSVWKYDEADTYVVQYDFLHLSFFEEEFKDFVETLLSALKSIERGDKPVVHLHPMVLRKDDPAEPGLNTRES